MHPIKTGMTIAAILGLAAFAETNPKIKVTLGEPNVWSLEQAHYLLEQRFARNQGLRPREPLPDDLDPNAINGNRFQALRQLITGGVGFDQQLSVQNSAARRRLNLDQSSFESNRAAQVASLQRQKALADQIAQLGQQKLTAAQAGAADGVLKSFDTAIAGQQSQLDAEKRDADRINASLNAVPTDLKSADAPKAEMAPFPSSFADLLKDKLSFGDPKLQASVALDNYINFQTELLMKQVTLLRDATPPDRRIVFVEFPQSFQVAGDSFLRRVRDRVVKIQWRVHSYIAQKDVKAQRQYEFDSDSSVGTAPYLRTELVRCMQSLYLGEGACDLQRGQRHEAYERSAKARQPEGPLQLTAVCEPGVGRYAGLSGLRDCYGTPITQTQPSRKESDNEKRSEEKFETPVAGTVRTLDLVPRVSSLNVNDKNYKSNGLALTGAFRFLTGLGASGSYQRQKETYEQFIHQEIFASAFGKGQASFGWTFGPNPGSRELSSGTRTTYAVFEIPRTALGITLEGRACTYKRNEVMPETWSTMDEDCEAAVVFHMPLPTRAQSDFWVKSIRESTSTPGARKILRLQGGYFSTLTGVTVDGVALRRSVAVANPELTPDPRPDAGSVPHRAISGEYEIIDGRELVLAFAPAEGYRGTPEIFLYSPIRSLRINELNFEDVESLDNRAKRGDVMFAPPPSVASYSTRTYPSGGYILQLRGDGFRSGTRVLLNGRELPPPEKIQQTGVLEFKIASLQGLDRDPVEFTVFNPEDHSASKAPTVSLPGTLRPLISDATVVGRDCGTKDCVPVRNSPNYWLFRVSGRNLGGVSASVTASDGTAMGSRLSPISPSEFLIRIEQREKGSFAVMTLTKSNPAGATDFNVSQQLAFKLPQPDPEDKFKDKEIILKRVPK